MDNSTSARYASYGVPLALAERLRRAVMFLFAHNSNHPHAILTGTVMLDLLFSGRIW